MSAEIGRFIEQAEDLLKAAGYLSKCGCLFQEGCEPLALQKLAASLSRHHKDMAAALNAAAASPNSSWRTSTDQLIKLFGRPSILREELRRKTSSLTFNGDAHEFIQQVTRLLEISSQLYPSDKTIRAYTVREAVSVLPLTMQHSIMLEVRREAGLAAIDQEWFRLDSADWDRVQHHIRIACSLLFRRDPLIRLI